MNAETVYLQRVLEARENSVRTGMRCGIYKHFNRLRDGWPNLAAYWFAQDGKVWFQPRGKPLGPPGMEDAAHERLNEEVSPERCARMLMEHAAPLSMVRVRPPVTITYADEC